QEALARATRASDGFLKQFEQLEELIGSSARITSSLELDQVLDQVLDSVISLTGAERAYLMLRDPDSDGLTIRKARNWDQSGEFSEDRAFSRNVIRTALEQSEPLVLMHVPDDPRFATVESVIAQGLQAALCIPLLLDGRAIGVLYADHRSQPGIFSES